MQFRFLLPAVLLTALISLGANVEVEFGPVPFILSDLFVLLAGLVLPWRWAATSLNAYLLLGVAGLPVFAGGESGFSYFTGPTFGYLVGFLLAAILISRLARSGPRSWLRDASATFCGQMVIFMIGVPWLKFQLELPWETAIVNGFLTFWLPILLKLCTAVALAAFLRKVFLPLPR